MAKKVRLENRSVARTGASLATNPPAGFLRPCEPTLVARPSRSRLAAASSLASMESACRSGADAARTFDMERRDRVDHHAARSRPMIRIAITAATFEALAAALPYTA